MKGFGLELNVIATMEENKEEWIKTKGKAVRYVKESEVGSER